jgi:hypothetical protein
LIRRWTVYLMLYAFVASVGLCLEADPGAKHDGPGSPFVHTTQVCWASLVLSKSESSLDGLLVYASSLSVHENTFYEGVSLTPPSPPPRG